MHYYFQFFHHSKKKIKKILYKAPLPSPISNIPFAQNATFPEIPASSALLHLPASPSVNSPKRQKKKECISQPSLSPFSLFSHTLSPPQKHKKTESAAPAPSSSHLMSSPPPTPHSRTSSWNPTISTPSSTMPRFGRRMRKTRALKDS